jgi:hypothetical protein
MRLQIPLLVGLARIELATSALSVLRSNRLSYSPGVQRPRRKVEVTRRSWGSQPPARQAHPLTSVDVTKAASASAPGPSMARCVPSAPNHCGFCAANAAQSATTALW